MSARHLSRFSCVGGLLVALASLDARAIPAFARKYGTSCQTCHTVYPKLNPFGEAFRRRGYRFPGVDADALKEQPLPLGQEAQARAFPQAIWPGTLPVVPPVALGFDGQAALHPDRHSGAARADNGAAFTLHDLVGSVHLWSGGSFDDWITFLAELTFDSTHGFAIETAQLHFNDLLGPPDALNLTVGQGHATLNSFGANSSYLADLAIPSVAVAALFGATSPTFALGDDTAGLELGGIGWRRLGYALGINAGSNLGVRPTENVYTHLGVKLGGLALDGSGASAPLAAPGQETAITVDLFAYHAISTFSSTTGALVRDAAWVTGAGLRAQLGAVELDSGATLERHDHARADLQSPGAVAAFVQYDELSWLALPWLVPAVRVELYRLAPRGSPAVWDVRVLPGLAVLIRPNLKLQLVAQFESASGAPSSGWQAAGAFAAPTSARPTIAFETESIWARLATAW